MDDRDRRKVRAWCPVRRLSAGRDRGAGLLRRARRALYGNEPSSLWRRTRYRGESRRSSKPRATRTDTGESWSSTPRPARRSTNGMPTNSSHPPRSRSCSAQPRALVELGPNHRFQTPLVRRGEVDARGTLHGDIILIAQGDLCLGGRTGADGTLVFKDEDHTYASGNLRSEIVPTDPLAGLEHLAREVKAAGSRKSTGT